MQAVNTILSVLGGSVFILALLSGIGYVFQQPMTAWLTKRISARLERQADDYRHQLARDIEEYKGQLSRLQNIDRIKMEVRKAVVDKLLEQRLAALHEVSAALGKFPTWAIAAMACHSTERNEMTTLTNAMVEFYEPMNRYALYFPPEFNIAYRNVGVTTRDFADEWTTGTIIPIDDPRALNIIQMSADAMHTVSRMHLTLPDELANIIAGESVN